jgi:hypothetical protein
MVTDQNHSSDVSSEQEVIRYTEKLAQMFGLNEQNAEVYSALSGENRALKKRFDDYHSEYISKKLPKSKKSKKGEVNIATVDLHESSSSEENGKSNVQVDECYQPKRGRVSARSEIIGMFDASPEQ